MSDRHDETAEIEALLSTGDLAVEGRLWDSSNSAMRVDCSSGGARVQAVYKPRRGERPLWDFPTGTLGRREVATYVVDRALGWGLVPVTVWREDAPMGPGSLQAWVEVDGGTPPVDVVEARTVPEGWHIVAEGEGARGDHVCLVHEESTALRRLAVLDAVVNNADRKGGHLLPTADGRIYGIDHGVTFSTEDKLRTVLWQWAGDRLTGAARERLRELEAALDDELAERLGELLTRREVRQTRLRVKALLATGRHPEPRGDWPPVPWPPI